MNKTQCLDKAAYYLTLANKAEQDEQSLGRLYGFADTLTVRAGEDAHRYGLEHALWASLADMSPGDRAKALTICNS